MTLRLAAVKLKARARRQTVPHLGGSREQDPRARRVSGRVHGPGRSLHVAATSADRPLVTTAPYRTAPRLYWWHEWVVVAEHCDDEHS